MIKLSFLACKVTHDINAQWLIINEDIKTGQNKVTQIQSHLLDHKNNIPVYMI